MQVIKCSIFILYFKIMVFFIAPFLHSKLLLNKVLQFQAFFCSTYYIKQQLQQFRATALTFPHPHSKLFLSNSYTGVSLLNFKCISS